jgi:hypothetical protein
MFEMNPDRDNEKLESYLRRFRAQSPKPLPQWQTYRFRPRMVLAWAAVFLIALSAAFYRRQLYWRQQRELPTAPLQSRRPIPIVKTPTLARLNRIAQEDPGSLDSYLNQLSKELLPDTRSSHGAFRQLAKE